MPYWRKKVPAVESFRCPTEHVAGSETGTGSELMHSIVGPWMIVIIHKQPSSHAVGITAMEAQQEKHWSQGQRKSAGRRVRLSLSQRGS